MSTIRDLAGTHSIHNLCKTVWTVCMSENAIGRHRPMCYSVHPPCNPMLMIKGVCGLVSNESAHTTDGEQRRHSSRCRRRRMNYLSERGFTSHSPPPSIILHQARPKQSHGEMPILIIKHPAPAQPFMILGNPLASREQLGSGITLESSATTFSAWRTVRLCISARFDAGSQCDCHTTVLNVKIKNQRITAN